MQKLSQQHIHPAAAKAFEAILHADPGSQTSNYYRARKLRRKGEARIKETLVNDRKLLGSLPEYATEDYRSWREEFVERHMILAEGDNLDELCANLWEDEFVSRWIPRGDLERLLALRYPQQSKGNRRLPNIKIRIVLDCLFELLEPARDLEKRAF